MREQTAMLLPLRKGPQETRVGSLVNPPCVMQMRRGLFEEIRLYYADLMTHRNKIKG